MATTVAPVIQASARPPGVVFRPVPGLAPLDFWARRDEDARAAVEAFMQAVITALGTS